MKNYSSLPLLGAALGLAVLTASCSDRSTTSDANSAAGTTTTAPANTTGAPTGTTTNPASATPSAFSSAATAINTAGTTALWSSLKSLPFERRDDLAAGVTRLESEVSNQAAALKAKRATLAGTNNQAWDFAMKEMVDAQMYLKSTAAELDKSTADTWEQAKEKVGQAWTRTQEAYGKVNANTTQ